MGGLAEDSSSDAIPPVGRRDTALAARGGHSARCRRSTPAARSRKARDQAACAAPADGERPARRVSLAWQASPATLERIGDLAKNIAKRALISIRIEPNRQLKRRRFRMGKIAVRAS
jgi:phosphate transport system protein